MGSIMWGREVAAAYDETYSAMFEPAVLTRTVDLLAELARGGHALEFAVGTGRVATVAWRPNVPRGRAAEEVR